MGRHRVSPEFLRVRAQRHDEILLGQRAGRASFSTAVSTERVDVPHRGLTRASLDEHARETIAYRAGKFGVDVVFVEHVDRECRLQRVRSGERVGVLDTGVTPRAYEAALVAFGRGAAAPAA